MIKRAIIASFTHEFFDPIRKVNVWSVWYIRFLTWGRLLGILVCRIMITQDGLVLNSPTHACKDRKLTSLFGKTVGYKTVIVKTQMIIGLWLLLLITDQRVSMIPYLVSNRQFYVDYPSFIETFLTEIALVQSNVSISVRLLHPWQE